MIRHRPSGETWTLAWADESEVICCGWPETFAKASDCVLVKAASDEEYIAMLRQVSEACPSQTRGYRCKYEIDHALTGPPDWDAFGAQSGGGE